MPILFERTWHVYCSFIPMLLIVTVANTTLIREAHS
jgi:hypothetical protein